jgi:transposase-like protein
MATPGAANTRPSRSLGDATGNRSFPSSPSLLRCARSSTPPTPSRACTARKAVRGRGHFPTDEAASKLTWLVLRNVSAKWKSPPISWHAAKAQLALQFQDRSIIGA